MLVVCAPAWVWAQRVDTTRSPRPIRKIELENVDIEPAARDGKGWLMLDKDIQLELEGALRRVIANARFTVVGLGVQPRYAFTLGARLRLFSSFYVLGSGGTLFFPQGDGTLNRGVTVSLGAGVDFER